MWASIVNYYNTNRAFHGLVAAVEGGVVMGFLTATTNGIDLSKKGLAVLGSSILGGIVMALRNRFTQPPEAK